MPEIPPDAQNKHHSRRELLLGAAAGLLVRAEGSRRLPDVVYDELDLPLCRLRIRRGGSSAGHNGVLSIMSSLKSHEFVRFRIGVGRPDGDGREGTGSAGQPGR